MASSMYIINLLFLVLGVVPNVRTSSCPDTCVCSQTPQRSVSCWGESLRHVTSLIPSDTVFYQYNAQEEQVELGETNFSHLTSLKVFNLTSRYDHVVLDRTIVEMTELQQYIFWPLINLKELRININWALATPLPELLNKMTKLEILDLSNTRIMDYTNLKKSLIGLKNSTAFRVLILHNSQTLEILKNGFTLDLGKLLDPVKNCPLEELDISYNALRTVFPGLLSKAKNLKKLDASNNLLIPLLSSVFFIETVVHPTLEVADFSEQGLGMVQRSSANFSMMQSSSEKFSMVQPSSVNSNMVQSSSENFSASKNSMISRWQRKTPNSEKCIVHSNCDGPNVESGIIIEKNNLQDHEENAHDQHTSPHLDQQEKPHSFGSDPESEVNTIRREIHQDNLAISEGPSFSHPLLQSTIECLDLIVIDFCNVFSPECAVMLHNCTEHHDYFCQILNFAEPQTVALPCDMIPPIQKLISPDCGGCLVFPLLGNIRVLYLQKLNNYDEVLAFPIFKDATCFAPNNSLEVMDFSRNREHGYADIDLSFSTSVVGFDSLRVMNLSYNKIQHPSPDFGANLPQIEVFDLSYNLLDLQGKYGEFIVGAVSVLELNLAGNIIENITYDKFMTLVQLRTLNLSSNILQCFSVDLRNLTQLSSIDLSNNKITSLSTDMTDQLSTQAAQLNHTALKIDLSKNPLLCTCGVRLFVHWILSKPQNIEFVNFDSYTCLNDDSSQVSLPNFNGLGFFACLSKKVLIWFGIGSGIVLSVIIAAIVIGIYRKRWWFRYHYFIARKMWWSSRKQERETKDFQYDIFVSYNNYDQDWVDEVLQPTLEDEHHIRLCLHLRDFRLGGVITDQILTSIDNSRKTLLILTPHFVQSNWCKFEMNMAHMKLICADQDVLLLAILKPLSNVEINKTLKSLLEKKNYVEWSENPYGQKLFWEKLIAALELPPRRPDAGAGAHGDGGDDGDGGQGREHPQEELPRGAEGGRDEGAGPYSGLHGGPRGADGLRADGAGPSSGLHGGPWGADGRRHDGAGPSLGPINCNQTPNGDLHVQVHMPANDDNDDNGNGTDENLDDERPLIQQV